LKRDHENEIIINTEEKGNGEKKKRKNQTSDI
jgi:hypothetical protein